MSKKKKKKSADNTQPARLPLSLPAGSRTVAHWIACTVPVLRDEHYHAIWQGPKGTRHNIGFAPALIDWKSTR